MNVDPLSIALSQISYLVSNLSKKNFKASCKELTELISLRSESDRHFLRCLLSEVDLNCDVPRSANSKDAQQLQLLAHEFSVLVRKPAFVSALCYAVDQNILEDNKIKDPSQVIPTLCKILKFTPVQEIIIGLALIHSSVAEVSNSAKELLSHKLPTIISNHISEDKKRVEGDLHDSSPETLHLILTYLLSSEETSGITAVEKELFLNSIRKDFPIELVPIVLAPILYPTTNTDYPVEKLVQGTPDMSKVMKEDALPELMKEIGYGFCASMDEGRRYLNMLDFEIVSAATIARILIMMTRTNSGLEGAPGTLFWHEGNPEGSKDKEGVSVPTSWNVEVFIQLLKEMKGNVVWTDVIAELDNGELFIKDRQSLGILMKALKLGFASQGYHPSEFPVDLLLRQWKYPECQFSLISQILKNPDIFCFTDYPIRTVSLENLKITPEAESKELSTWRSIDLLDLLMFFAENGMQKQVHELLKFPVQNTADVLISALLQSSQTMTIFKRDVINNIMPIFFANHPNSGAVIHMAWQTQNIVVRQILMHCMADWYLRGECDQTRLSRILDLIHDLKALSTLLNMSTYPFVIDLACLASRREYLKLEKWLTDKIRDQGESFVNSLIDFVKRRFLGVLPKTEYVPKYAHLPQETVAVILASLQICIGSFSPEVTENVMNLIANCNLVINKGRPMPQGVLRPNRNIDPLSFQHNQLFSSQNTDQMSCITSGLSNISLTQPNNGFNVSRDVMIPLPPELQCQVTKDVEEEANTYFQKIYNQPPNLAVSPDYIIDLLKNFKDSQDKRERELFMCMVRNLFEEYKFFPQYPDKELRTTAQLFGGVLQMNLITETPLFGIGLRLILDSLKKYGNPKMFIFGVTALEQIKTRLKEMPKICELFMNLSNFSDFPRSLAEYVEYGFQGLDPPQRNPVPTTSLSSNLSPFKAVTNAVGSNNSSPGSKLPTSRPSLLNSTNIDTLLGATEKDEKIVPPPETIQDKVAFIFNNLSQLNLSLKCEEMRGLIREEYLHWLAQYLVMKRASIEQNFHVLYSNFIDCVQIQSLLKLVIKETYRNIKVLLDSDKCMLNFSDRTLLKNLGHWLGIITLGKNKPILASDVDIPMLLVEAYQKGLHELMYIVPFVAKILESCAKSRVFQPRNPWTMWTLGLLAEIHQDEELKLNLKFEIEVLCKNLQVDLKDIPVLQMLKEGHLVTHMTYQLSNGNKGHSTSSSSSSPLPSAIISHAPPTPPAHSVAPSSVILPSSSIASSPSSVAASTSSSGEEIPFIPPANSSAMPGSSTTPPMPEPRFNFLTFNVTAVNSLSAMLTVNGQLPLFQTHPHLKGLVRPAFERAVQDWMVPIVDRSVKIAVNTSEHIVKKDFALDPDESRVRAAAHYIVRNLAAGMAMITCREQIINSFTLNLKNNFLGIIMNANSIQKELIEQTITATVNDNMDLACAYVQKSAVEKALVDIDRHLFTEYERRRNARNEGRRYCDSGILTYQAERVPEQVRLKVGDVSPQQMVVYEEFAKNIPGFQPLTDKEAALFSSKPSVTLPFGSSNDEVGQMFEKLASELEVYLQSTTIGPLPNTAHINSVHAIIDLLLNLRRSRDSNTAVMLVTKVVEGLIDGLTQMASNPDVLSRYQEFYLRILKCLQDPRAFGIPWTNKQVTRALVESRDDQRYNLEAVDFLIRTHFINLPIYDACMAQSMENGGNYVAVVFSMQLVQHYLVQTQDRSQSLVTDQDFRNIVETLIRIAGQTRHVPDGLIALTDILKINLEASGNLAERSQSGVAAYIHSGILQARNNEQDDSPMLVQKTNYLLQEWGQIYQVSPGKDPGKSFSLFVQQMNVHGILKTDDLITRFFRIATQIVVNISYKEYSDPNYVSGNPRNKIFLAVDSFVKLISLLVRHSGDATNTSTKLNLLNKVLGIVAGVTLQDQEKYGKNFIPIGYYRLFSMLFLELNGTDPILDLISHSVLQAFTHTYHILRPSKAPGFTYSWLSLISHRLFISKALFTPGQKGWSLYAHLLIDLFKYLAPFLRNTELAKPVTMLYKGTLRVLLVLLHDFPEFLCDYHYGLCDVIPPNCIQLRNLILSAFPRSMRLPDPFTPNLKVDMLPEITQTPRIATNYIASLAPESFKRDLDSYLKERAPVTFLSELRTSLQVCSEPGSKYNIALVNSLVLYVGTQAITHIRSKGTSPTMSNITHSAHMDIFQNLSVDLDTEGRYLFLNAIANQLRYPNSHTHYFSCALLYLFGEANAEVIQEQITRVLLERIIVNRPHPWGLLITFIELIKNPTYNFWDHEFVTCAPEIEKLFESVARSCMVTRQIVAAAVGNENTHEDPPPATTILE